MRASFRRAQAHGMSLWPAGPLAHCKLLCHGPRRGRCARGLTDRQAGGGAHPGFGLVQAVVRGEGTAQPGQVRLLDRLAAFDPDGIVACFPRCLERAGRRVTRTGFVEKLVAKVAGDIGRTTIRSPVALSTAFRLRSSGLPDLESIL